MALSERLDFELAWDKAESNLQDSSRIFVNNPYITDIINRNKKNYVDIMNKTIDNGYDPSESRIINIPKAGWKVRPGTVLQIQDVVMYSALVLEIYRDIRDTIKWSAMERRFSRILRDNKSEKGWIRYPGETWEKWNRKSKKLMQQHDYIVFSDIASFFENIEHRVLHSDLRDLTDKTEIISQIRECLKRWSHPRERGLPQGYYPSDILSEVYLNRVDEKLKINDIEHTRFSDNVRMFCDTKREAIYALEKLTEIYRDRGLNLQSKKTEIVDSDTAQERLKHPNRVIDEIEPKVKDSIDREREGGSPYDGGTGGNFTSKPTTDGGEKEDIDPEEIEIDEAILESAFQEHIIENDSFDQHLFRYLITRLGYFKNDYAVNYCIQRIKEGRTETRHILDRYFGRLSNKEKIAEDLSDLVENEDIIYEFQEFAIIRWLFEYEVETNSVLSMVRDQVRNGHNIIEVENYSIAYLGKHGNKVDIDTIYDLYGDSRDRFQRATILMAIRDMEKSLRNSVYSQAESDDILCKYAVQLAKETSKD